MLEKLSSALKKGIEKITNAIFVDNKIIEEVVRELQRALIQADVNILLVKELGDKIKKEAKKENIKGIEKKEHLIKVLYDEVVALVGKEKQELRIEKKDKLNKIMLVGLYGSGKTTTAAKLAYYYMKRGFKTALLGLDVHRPAASEQLKQLGEKINVPVFIKKDKRDALKIYEEYEEKLKKFDLVIIDTAGRHSLDEDLVNEIKSLSQEIKPDYVFLVMQADIGQAAKTQAAEFKRLCNVNGIIITRMDSSAKGGGALTACNETDAPVIFIGTGEKINELERFNPKSFVSRLLGMGDLESLLERVESAIDEQTQKKLRRKIEKKEFDLKDFQEQLKQMSNVGSFSRILDLIPGFGKAKISDDILGNQEEKMKRWIYAIDSMTEEERQNYELLEKESSRLRRIAKGSGTTTGEIRQLIKQFKILKEIAEGGELSEIDPSQGLSQKQLMRLAKKFGRKIKF